MRSKPVSQLLVDLGVVRSHSRPHVSRRQPVLRGAVQDDQALPSVLRALRLNRAGPRVLRRLLRPLQPHPPPLGYRATHASISPLRYRPGDPSQAPSHLQRGLRGQPNTLLQQGTNRPSTPRGRLDQSTPRRGACTEQLDQPCLIRLDRFRDDRALRVDRLTAGWSVESTFATDLLRTEATIKEGCKNFTALLMVLESYGGQEEVEY